MRKILFALCLGLLAMAGVSSRSAAATVGLTTLSGHVPAVVKTLTATGNVAATNILQLAIGLPLRNQAMLAALLQQINDPASQNYHHYLTPDQFTAQFGPTPAEYQAVIDFATANGLTVTHIHGNRMVVEVRGAASDVEHAFNITLKTYQHPAENRVFYAPDAEPSVPAGLPVLDISGLNNYARPHTKLKFNPNNQVSPHTGSGPGGNYLGYDFRSAYVPGTTLTGAGQKIALVQFDGYFASDIAQYAAQAGLPGAPLTNILLNGFSGIPTGTGGEVEVSLDIEMVISMAPNLSQVLVYEGDPFNFLPNVVLNQIAVDNSARQISCSWGWVGGPNATSDQIFQEMIVQGQTFFNASGDSDAFLPGQVDDPNQFGFPSCTPFIIQVGGTTLTTSGPGGSRIAETVWNWGLLNPVVYDGVGSSGGISDHYSTPSWQVGFGTPGNHGSATGRNIPDVALTADNVYVIADNGIAYPGTGGTSCAAPLWAGFTALVNQQAALSGKQPVGFINPSIYAIAKTPAYATDFNDITTGNNTWSSSPTNFFAVSGYDLCTGLGTPSTSLIADLANGSISTGPIVSAPRPPYGSTLSVMNGTDPNGPWFLFVQDDSVGDIGSIANGWQLNLTTAIPVPAAADVGVSMTATPPGSALVASNVTFVVAATNYGPSSATNVVVVDTLPPGVTLVSSNATTGSGSFTVSGSVLTWSLGNLATNAGGQLTLVVQALSAGSIANSAYAITNDADPNPDDNLASATVNVTAPIPATLSGGSVVNGVFQLHVAGTAGASYIVQASTNLVTGPWIPLVTNVSPFTFMDTYSSNFPARFYRTVTGP